MTQLEKLMYEDMKKAVEKSLGRPLSWTNIDYMKWGFLNGLKSASERPIFTSRIHNTLESQ